MDRKKKLLKDIAKLITTYENPTGSDCSNDVGAEITLDFGRETEQTFSYNGESFVEVKDDQRCGITKFWNVV